MAAATLDQSDSISPGCLTDTSCWQLAAAQKRGSSHEAAGTDCEDAYRVAMLSPDLLVIAVADGAGSAQYAEAGASTATQRGVAQLCAALDQADGDLDDTVLEDMMREAMTAALAAVQAEAAGLQVNARDLATTLILVVAKKEFVAVAQIGDGATVISDDAGKIISLTVPPVGEYINESTFLTSADALLTAQVKIRRGRATRIAAFSDGLQMLCLKWPEYQPHEAFFMPLFDFVATTIDELQAANDLAKFLSSARVSELTNDDLTLVLAALKDTDDGS